MVHQKEEGALLGKVFAPPLPRIFKQAKYTIHSYTPQSMHTYLHGSMNIKKSLALGHSSDPLTHYSVYSL